MKKAEIQNEFTEKIGRLTKSPAYLDVCEEMCGCREYQFNMMDKEQLDFVLNAIPLRPDDTLLELGCGACGLLRRLTGKYGCHSVGIDLLEPAIAGRNADGIRYLCDDLDRIAEHNVEPTVTLAVDSLYFSDDLDKLIQYLVGVGGNRLYLFYSQYLVGDCTPDKTMLRSENTVLGRAISKAAAPYKALDFSENEQRMYLAAERALRKREPEFTAENNAD